MSFLGLHLSLSPFYLSQFLLNHILSAMMFLVELSQRWEQVTLAWLFWITKPQRDFLPEDVCVRHLVTSWQKPRSTRLQRDLKGNWQWSNKSKGFLVPLLTVDRLSRQIQQWDIGLEPHWSPNEHNRYM